MRRLAVLLIVLTTAASAQDQTVLFPGQSGAELRASIRAAYRPVSLTGDNDDLYARIDSITVDGQLGVVGVYSGLFVPFDGVPNSDPSQDVFNNGSGINQEHTFPRAELAGSSSHPSEDDLHNLFPTRVSVNADRGNLPFAEIPDALTTRWYRESTATSTDPPQNERDAWSELQSSRAFEPRESHEGNVARAMFYMATVWNDVADLSWFEDQQDDLYDWHRADPVDQAEVDRSALVSAYQRNADGIPAPNPFVVDSTLIRRAYFPGMPVSTSPEAPSALSVELAGPNPSREGGQVRVRARGPVRVVVLDALGREAVVLHVGPLPPEGRVLSVPPLAPGVYTVVAVGQEDRATRRLVLAR
ncbi:MAG: endonuclease [Bacteroidota bacterium]